jgi:DNA-binding Lrp family transcriptional regulator
MKKTGPKPESGETRNNPVTVKFTNKELKEIEEIAKNINISRTTLIRNMTLAGLEDAKILNKIGALKGARKLLDFKERFLHPEKYKTLENV